MNEDRVEIGKFDAIAHRFWDPAGDFRPLHLINPVRTAYIAGRCELAGARVLDIGCGGGLLCEALQMRGARVTGIDLAPAMIETARLLIRPWEPEDDAGFRAMAPQVFDRMSPNFESGYSEAEVAKAREFIPRLDWAKLMLDASAAVDALKKEGGPVAMIGFCMGGTVAFIAATRLGGLAASVCYYGGQIVRFADNKPRCPVQMHFGEKDASIPMSDVETIRQKRPECEIFTYPGAGHGFLQGLVEDRGDSAAAHDAWARTLECLLLAIPRAAALQRPKRSWLPPAPITIRRKWNLSAPLPPISQWHARTSQQRRLPRITRKRM